MNVSLVVDGLAVLLDGYGDVAGLGACEIEERGSESLVAIVDGDDGMRWAVRLSVEVLGSVEDDEDETEGEEAEGR